MVFWLGVLVGGLFVFIGVKMGFFATWIMLGNLVLSTYMAVFLTPVIVASVPAATSSPHGFALIFVSVFVATLLIAYGACYGCLSGQLRVEFPKLFDIASGILGFLSGFLLWSFASFSLCLSPLSQEDSFRNLGFDASSQETSTNKSYLCWWCDRVHGFVGSSDSDNPSEETLGLLLMQAGVSSAGSSDSGASGPPIIRKPPATSPSQGSSSKGSTAQKTPSGTSPTTQSGKSTDGEASTGTPANKQQVGRDKEKGEVEPKEKEENTDKDGKKEQKRPREKQKPDLFDEPEK